jgi:hypothetical protein
VLTHNIGVGSHLEQIALRRRVHQEGDGGVGEEQRLVQDTQESERLSLRPVSGQSVSQSRFSLTIHTATRTHFLLDRLLGVARPASVLRPARNLQGPPRPAARDERVQVRRGLSSCEEAAIVCSSLMTHILLFAVV